MVQTLAKIYLEEKAGKVKVSTLKCYQRNIKCHILPKLGDQIAANLTVEDIDDYLEAMQESFSPSWCGKWGHFCWPFCGLPT